MVLLFESLDSDGIETKINYLKLLEIFGIGIKSSVVNICTKQDLSIKKG